MTKPIPPDPAARLAPVVITRPLAQAGALAGQISDLGREAIVFPLLDILPIDDPAPLRAALARLRGYAMIAFVSPNAIDAAFAALPCWPAGMTLAVMGEGSRGALARHGVTSANAVILSPRDAARSDSQTLLEALDIEALRGKKVLIVRGESGRELLADALRGAGVEVEQVAAYRRAAPPFDDERRARLRQLIDSDNDWIVTSSESLRILLDMAWKSADEQGVVKMQHKTIIVPHRRIKEGAEALGFQYVMLTGAGDEGLLAALQSQR
jgi:uroporphyrinogen-III synthase